MEEADANRTGFSLVELLVVLSIIAVLAGLLLPVLSGIRLRADRVTAVSQMRQIAVGMAAYSADHNNKLPGPLFPGQMPMLDTTRAGRLVVILASYLNITLPTVPRLIPLFVPPAYQRDTTAAFLVSARTYVMNFAVPTATGAILNPWGDAVTGVGQPLSAGSMPGETWAFSDADQLHPRVIGASWQTNTPPILIHGDRRLAARFDGSVGDIDASELAVPTP